MPDGDTRYDNQIQFSKMSDSNDFGSLIVTPRGNNPVALGFTGSSSTTIGHPIFLNLEPFPLNNNELTDIQEVIQHQLLKYERDNSDEIIQLFPFRKVSYVY